MTSTLLKYTPRTKRPAAPAMVRNNAGGASYTVDLWQRFMRFLVIGTETGTYYVSERKHTLDNIKVVKDAIAADHRRAVDMLTEVSQAGRAPKNDYAIYALAVAASTGSVMGQAYALNVLPFVCRTGTHLFQFVAFIDTMRGWGPALRKAVAKWYLDKTPDNLAYQVLKYQQREGWSHRDVLRKAHPLTTDPQMNCIFQFITQGVEGIKDPFATTEQMSAYFTLQQYVDADIAVDFIKRFNLSREMIPTELLTNTNVLRALAEKSPYTALIRNLGNMTRHKVLEDQTTHLHVIEQITNPIKIAKARVHPISILTAHRTYAQGTGFRGSNTWMPDRKVVNALDAAFYESFKHVAPTGKRFFIGLDISGSMRMRLNDGILTSAEIAAALAMTIIRTEPWCKVVGFNNQLTPLSITPNDTLESALTKTAKWNGGSTDCAQPMLYALANNLAVDCFIVITDNETWAGHTTPADALRQYREKSGIDAKLIVLATAATPFSIADPNDKGMLDVAGFDSSVPEIIRLFVNGDI